MRHVGVTRFDHLPRSGGVTFWVRYLSQICDLRGLYGSPVCAYHTTKERLYARFLRDAPLAVSLYRRKPAPLRRHLIRPSWVGLHPVSPPTYTLSPSPSSDGLSQGICKEKGPPELTSGPVGEAEHHTNGRDDENSATLIARAGSAVNGCDNLAGYFVRPWRYNVPSQ
jgi:hypothetical protein